LLLYLPPPSVLPERKANITPSGQLSTKAWTKTELNQVYAQLLAMHLLATLREAWAVAPSLQSIRVIGLGGPAAANGMIFDVTCNRGDPHTEIDDSDGSRMVAWLAGRDIGLHRKGRTGEVTSWPPSANASQLGEWLTRPSPRETAAPWTQPILDPADPEPNYSRPVPPRPAGTGAPPVPAPGAGRRRATGSSRRASPGDRIRIGPGLAFIASFFVAGLGSLVNRRRIGVVILGGWLLSFLILATTPASVGAFALLTMTGCWIWGLIDAVVGARRDSSAQTTHSV
jgi:hypothetical protein